MRCEAECMRVCFALAVGPTAAAAVVLRVSVTEQRTQQIKQRETSELFTSAGEEAPTHPRFCSTAMLEIFIN